ncbi:MAG: hypothetical protein ACLS69_08140, partial [Butyricicoccus sp.]
GTLSPLDTEKVPKETFSDNPLSSAQRTRPRRCGAGSGIKVRQSWTLIRNLMRRTAVRLFCLFRRKRNAAEICYTYK